MDTSSKIDQRKRLNASWGAVVPRSLFSPFLFKELSKVLVAMLRYEAVVDGIEQGFYRYNRRELCGAYVGKTGRTVGSAGLPQS